VLQEDKNSWPVQHLAFTVAEGDLETAAAALLKQAEVIERPVYHWWMPAKSVYSLIAMATIWSSALL